MGFLRAASETSCASRTGNSLASCPCRSATVDFLDLESHGRGTSMGPPPALPRRRDGKLVERGKSSGEAAEPLDKTGVQPH
ncbi:MAG: hypothetical protein AB7W37_14690 [Syntrophobacteraceae bacterium]